MPKLKTEDFSGDDYTWLGSAHGLANARTETLDISAFTAATHYPEGFIPSGTPVAKTASGLVPFDSAEGVTDGAGVLAGFILTNQRVVGSADFAVPLLDHGRVVAVNVPGAFTVPTGAKRGETAFVFVS